MERAFNAVAVPAAPRLVTRGSTACGTWPHSSLSHSTTAWIHRRDLHRCAHGRSRGRQGGSWGWRNPVCYQTERLLQLFTLNNATEQARGDLKLQKSFSNRGSAPDLAGGAYV